MLQALTGWFDLLASDVGRRQYSPAFDEDLASKGVHSADLGTTSTHTVTVGRTKRDAGFGFTITEDGPFVYVTRVTPESAADRAGLKVDDRIVGIDGVEVEGAGIVGLAQIIRFVMELKLYTGLFYNIRHVIDY